MKKANKKDFKITTRGIEIIQNLAIFQLVVTSVIGILAAIGASDISSMLSIGILMGTLLLALPPIVVICLVNMVMDYMFNVEQQCKIQSNLDFTTRKILEEMQVANSYRYEKAN